MSDQDKSSKVYIKISIDDNTSNSSNTIPLDTGFIDSIPDSDPQQQICNIVASYLGLGIAEACRVQCIAPNSCN